MVSNDITKIKITRESKIQFLLIYFWIYSSLISYTLVFCCRILGISDETAHIIITIVTILAVVSTIDSWMRLLKLRQIVFYFLVLLVYLMSYKLFPLNEIYLDENFATFFLSVVPLFFLGCMVDKVQVPYLTLLRFSRIVIVFFFIVLLFFSVTETGDHDMGKAYNCLPSIMLVSYSALKGRKGIDVGFMILGALFLVICATRGPILLYVIFMLFQSTFFSRKLRYLYMTFLVGIFLIFISPLGFAIIEGLAAVMEKLGFSARIFELLLSGDLADDNGRSWLTDSVQDMIQKHPLFGNGIFSDRRATESIALVRGESRGIYVHNLLYEVWCAFGYLLGTVLLLLLLICIIKTFMRTETYHNFKIIALIFLLSYVGRLFMSGSFMIEPGFWFCVGLFYEGMGHIRKKSFKICFKKRTLVQAR